MKISEQILEIRYKPNPKILDHRGTWAEGISHHMNFPEWRIFENRIDIYDKVERHHVFVGFRNCGFVTINAPTKNYFSDQATKLMNYLKNFDDFGKILFVERIGVRSKFCQSVEGNFESLKEKYQNKFLNLSDEAKKIINAKLIDIGGPLNFVDDVGNFNTMSGPMEKKQILQFFERIKEDLPDIGFYFDIDYWMKPGKNLKIEEMTSKVKEFTERSWERFEKIYDLITRG